MIVYGNFTHKLAIKVLMYLIVTFTFNLSVQLMRVFHHRGDGQFCRGIESDNGMIIRKECDLFIRGKNEFTEYLYLRILLCF